MNIYTKTITRAIAYAAFQDTTSCIGVCDENYEVSLSRLHGAYRQVVTEMHKNSYLHTPVEEFIEGIDYLKEIDTFMGIPCEAKTLQIEAILNALLYSIEQVVSSDIDVCDYGAPGIRESITKKKNIGDLLQAYWRVLAWIYTDRRRKGHDCALPFEMAGLRQYDATLLADAMRHAGSAAKATKALYLVERAKCTAEAKDAWAAVDCLHDPMCLETLLKRANSIPGLIESLSSNK